jgi:signal transduction histidine kinase
VRLRPTSVTLLAAVVAGGATDIVIFVPSLHYAYRSVPIHVMLETAATLIGLLTTFLLWGRLRERQRFSDLLLFVALAVLSLTNLLFAAIPAVHWSHPHPFSTWTTLAAGALGAALLALAALIPDGRLENYERAAKHGVLAAAASLVAVAAVVGVVVDRLPSGIDPSHSQAHWPVIGSNAIVMAQVFIAGLFALGAFGFTRRAEREGDELLLWLGAGSAVAAFARVNYFVFPSLYSEWVYTGDALRLCFSFLLFIGAAREIHIYQEAFAQTRVLDERRRIARDLHDGLAQELAYIVRTTREMGSASEVQPEVVRIAASAERALDESRRAIAALSLRLQEPFDAVLVQTVEDLAQRLDARILIDAEPSPALLPNHQEQLLRIVREAVANAARHGGAEVVRVRLTNRGQLRISVDDDGVGFDPVHPKAQGFGLLVMRERAKAIGADFSLSSKPAGGTHVEVMLP